MADNGAATADGRVRLGISWRAGRFIPRDAIDAFFLRPGSRRGGRTGSLPPHVMVYFVMALALFADDDYEEVAARLTETLMAWGCWDDSWSVPASGGITQARQRLGYEP